MPVAVDGRKVCSKCRERKPLTAFTVSRATSDGRQSWCMTCTAKRSLELWRAKPYEEQTGASLKRRYGITYDDYLRRSEAQGHVCAICRQPERRCRNGKPMRLVVDHDHRTGRIRGLLCHDCNTALGRFRDSPDLLAAAITYLEGAR